MNKIFLIGCVFILAGCAKDTPSQPGQPLGKIVAYVHWQGQGLADKQIVLLETGDTLRTDSKGLAEFSVPAGHYVIRAFDINRGGPCCGSIDFDVETKPGDTTRVDIVDCLPCV